MTKKLIYLLCLSGLLFACSGEESAENESNENKDVSLIEENLSSLTDSSIKTFELDTFLFSQIQEKEYLSRIFGSDTGIYFNPPNRTTASGGDSCVFAFNLPQNTIIDTIFLSHIYNYRDTSLNYSISLKDSVFQKNHEMVAFKLGVDGNQLDRCRNATVRVKYNSRVIDAVRVSVNRSVPDIIKGAGDLVGVVPVNNNQTRDIIPYSGSKFKDYDLILNTPDYYSYSQTNQGEVLPVEMLLGIPGGKVIESINILDTAIGIDSMRTYELIVGTNPAKPRRMEPFSIDLSWGDFQRFESFIMVVYEGNREKKKKVLKADTDSEPDKKK